MPTQQRQAKNEALFREVNERIRDLTAGFELDVAAPAQFVCECSDPDCTDQLQVPLDEYEAVRADATHFLVAPGHERPELEHVIRTTDRFVVVEKDAQEDVLEASDPR